MTAVFIHGVADTYTIWDEVRSHLRSVDSVALALPGFDAALPPGFPADKESYIQWIIGQLEQFPTPVDLVGHDWGCIFALRIASLRPDLIRTVAAGNGPISQDYEWHHLARIWQTPDEGEKFMSELTSQTLSDMLRAHGVPSDAANATAQRVDERMKTAILKLYRSAIDVGDDWQPGLAHISCTATIFWGRHDTDCPVRFAYEMAGQLIRGRVVEIDCGHWVPLEKPIELAHLLQEHWKEF
jgi:pimeloyl-ACP methyl ester carboxylesterase